jgi:hypothetical protein
MGSIHLQARCWRQDQVVHDNMIASHFKMKLILLTTVLQQRAFVHGRDFDAVQLALGMTSSRKSHSSSNARLTLGSDVRALAKSLIKEGMAKGGVQGSTKIRCVYVNRLTTYIVLMIILRHSLATTTRHRCP